MTTSFLRVAWLGALVAAAACGSEARPARTGPGVRATVRIRVFTETSGARLLETMSNKYVFAATAHGIERWDLMDGRVLAMGNDQGLPGDRVVSFGVDRERGWLWIATDAGLGYYDVQAGVFSAIQSPPGAI